MCLRAVGVWLSHTDEGVQGLLLGDLTIDYHQHSKRVAYDLSLLLVAGPLPAFQRGACSRCVQHRSRHSLPLTAAHVWLMFCRPHLQNCAADLTLTAVSGVGNTLPDAVWVEEYGELRPAIQGALLRLTRERDLNWQHPQADPQIRYRRTLK
jgi:hypothetical protein